MKATGIVRRIDDLGRVVIPKEIRRTMRIREGDPLEIYTGGDGDVIFKKYSPVGELAGQAAICCEALIKCTEKVVLVCDRDHCIAAAGTPKKEVLERRVTPTLEEQIETRRPYFKKAAACRRWRARSFAPHRFALSFQTGILTGRLFLPQPAAARLQPRPRKS